MSKLSNGWASDLSIEQDSLGLNSLSNKESNSGEHTNTSVGELSLTVTLEGHLIGLGGESKRIEDSDGRKSTGDRIDGEGVEAGGAGAGLGRGEGSGRAGKSGDKSKLHHVCSSVLS